MRVVTATLIVTVAAHLAVSVGQELPKEPVQLTFRAQTDLVAVPFEVRRGSRPVSNLTSSDVVLFEDGRPRAFTGFEPPPERPSLELVVMFDVTDVQRGGFWNAEALHDLASVWNDAMSRTVLEDRERPSGSRSISSTSPGYGV